MSEYKLVPVEPTLAMVRAFIVSSGAASDDELDDPGMSGQLKDAAARISNAYAATLAAAPAPEQKVEQECGCCGQTVECDDDCDSRLFGKKGEQEPSVTIYEAARGEASPTHGMNLGERIAHVGGRTKENTCVEFGSIMAVSALIQHVLRDLPAPPAPPAAPDVSELVDLLQRVREQYRDADFWEDMHPIMKEIDAALSAHREQQGGEHGR